MFDSIQFCKRLETLMNKHRLSAAGLAKKLGVQRSLISHIFSGRNKPGLEFLLKVDAAFPEANLLWLIKGEEPPAITKEVTEIKVEADKPLAEKTSTPQSALEQAHLPFTSPANPPKGLKQIIFIYEDKTFEVYSPSSSS